MFSAFDVYSIQPNFTLNGKRYVSSSEGVFFSILFFILSSLVIIYNFYNVYKENNPIILVNEKFRNESSVEIIPSSVLDFGLTLVKFDFYPKATLNSVNFRDFKTLNLEAGGFAELTAVHQKFTTIFEESRTIAGNFTQCNRKYGNHTLMKNSFCTNYIRETQEIGGNLIDISFLKKMNVYFNPHYCDLLFDTSNKKTYENSKEYDEFIKIINKSNPSESDLNYIKSLNIKRNYQNLTNLEYIYPFKTSEYLSDPISKSERDQCMKLFSQDELVISPIKKVIQFQKFYYGFSYVNNILNTDVYKGYDSVIKTEYFDFYATEQTLLIHVTIIKNVVETDDNLFFQFGTNRIEEFYEIKIETETTILEKQYEAFLPIIIDYKLNNKVVYTH